MMEEKDIFEGSPLVSKALKPKRRLTPEVARDMANKAKKSPRHGKHGKLKKTLMKEEVYKMLQDRLVERALKLVDTQTVIAHGTIKIYKIVTHKEGKKTIKLPPELVTDEEEIARVIAYEYGDGENPNDDEDYFFVSTKDPDNKAIQAQLDRVFGKSSNKVDITSQGEKVTVIAGMEIIREPKETTIQD